MIVFKKINSISEAAKVSELARKIYEEHFIPLIGVEQVDYMLEKFLSEKAIMQQIENGSKYISVYYDNELAGFIAIKREENRLFLSKFYLEKEYRGKGISRKMLNEVISYSQGLSSIYLTVNKDNIGPINVYKNFGFVITDSAVTDIGGGFVMDDYIMEKAL